MERLVYDVIRKCIFAIGEHNEIDSLVNKISDAVNPDFDFLAKLIESDARPLIKKLLKRDYFQDLQDYLDTKAKEEKRMAEKSVFGNIFEVKNETEKIMRIAFFLNGRYVNIHVFSKITDF